MHMQLYTYKRPSQEYIYVCACQSMEWPAMTRHFDGHFRVGGTSSKTVWQKIFANHEQLHVEVILPELLNHQQGTHRVLKSLKRIYLVALSRLSRLRHGERPPDISWPPAARTRPSSRTPTWLRICNRMPSTAPRKPWKSSLAADSSRKTALVDDGLVVEWLMVVELVMNGGWLCYGPVCLVFLNGWLILFCTVLKVDGWSGGCRVWNKILHDGWRRFAGCNPGKISILNPNMEVWFRWFCFSIGWFFRFQQCNGENTILIPKLGMPGNDPGNSGTILKRTSLRSSRRSLTRYLENQIWLRWGNYQMVLVKVWGYEVSLVWFFILTIWNLTLYEYITHFGAFAQMGVSLNSGFSPKSSICS